MWVSSIFLQNLSLLGLLTDLISDRNHTHTDTLTDRHTQRLNLILSPYRMWSSNKMLYIQTHERARVPNFRMSTILVLDGKMS